MQELMSFILLDILINIYKESVLTLALNLQLCIYGLHCILNFMIK